MTENVKNWIAAAHECQAHPDKAPVLPIVRIDDQYHFLDVRLNALRNIDTFEFTKFGDVNELIRFVMRQGELIV
jgi:hypothetical protein